MTQGNDRDRAKRTVTYDPRLNLDSVSIKGAIWHEGKTPREKRYMQYLMRKVTRGITLVGEESDDYQTAYRRIYSRRYRKLNRRKVNEYRKKYRKTHPERIRQQQRNYRQNPNNGYQAYAHRHYRNDEYRKRNNERYKRRYPNGPDEKRRRMNREYSRAFRDKHRFVPQSNQ